MEERAPLDLELARLFAWPKLRELFSDLEPGFTVGAIPGIEYEPEERHDLPHWLGDEAVQPRVTELFSS
ncbi:hypothetical protein AB0N09_42850 [Streptomyces erythrochromogenes]|uniref:hypothetical protein n=1 Tax=Streptomyces erythrochromogenes TaxID=285574 RepID=UPI00341E226F